MDLVETKNELFFSVSGDGGISGLDSAIVVERIFVNFLLLPFLHHLYSRMEYSRIFNFIGKF